MRAEAIFGTQLTVIGVLLWCCMTQGVWGATGNYLSNLPSCPVMADSCTTCPGGTPVSGAGTGCAWVKINAGPMRPGSSVKAALFRMGENHLTESIYTPQSLSFVAGYAMKGISHEVTRDGSPRQVIMVESGGIPFALNFKDGESIGVPVFGDAWVMKLRVFMVDANGWATLANPAYYDLYTGDGERYRFNAFKTSPQYMQLVSHRTVAGREETYQDMGVEVIRDASQNMRQVLLPTRLADIVVSNSSHYAVKFYTLASLDGKDTNGFYRISTNATPFESWSFGNPEPGTVRKLLVTRVMGSRTTVYDFTYQADSDNWTLLTGDGTTVARQEEDGTLWNDARTEQLSTRSVKAADGSLVSRYVEKIKTFSWGAGVTQRITDPNGANLTNTFTYNAAGLTETAVEPDGSWRWRGYDAAGRVTTELSPVKDSALTSVANAARAVVTSYAPVDPLDSSRLNDQSPRTVTESVLGTVVARTYRAYRQGGNGELQEIVEKAASPSAPYGAANNLRTVTTYYGTNVSNHQIGRMATVVHPDGRMETHSYDYGLYQSGSGATPPSFEANSAGSYWCETIVHGTTDHPQGIAGKTTKETRILDSMSQEVLSEIWVCTGEANYERVAWVSKGYDEWQHPVLVTKSNGEKTEASWGGNCCGKEWEIDSAGVQLDYLYDTLSRVQQVVKAGNAATGQPDLYTAYTYDAAGHRLSQTVFAGGLSQTQSNSYDLVGRLLSSVDAQEIVTVYGYNGLASTVIRGGLTNTTTRYLDGTTKSTAENGAVKTWYDHGVNGDGTRWTKVFSGPQGTNSPAWQKTITDLLGRTVHEEKPGFGGTILTSSYTFNSMGQLTQASGFSSQVSLYEYDEQGQQIRTGIDVNTNGVLDLAGPDRVNASDTFYQSDSSNNWWQVRASIIYAGDSSAVPVTNSVTRTLIGGSSCGCAAQLTESRDLLGNITVSRALVDRPNKTVTQIVTYPDSTNSAVQTTINGQLTTSLSKTGVRTEYAYDTLGRQIEVRSSSGAGVPPSRSIATVTHYNAKGQVDSTMDAASNTTVYAYDALGRRTAVTDALSNSTYTAYDAEGRVLATWGGTYPVAYDYDDFGRMTAMYTYRGTNTLSSYSEIANLKSQMDHTTWLYELATGLLTNKVYADGQGPAYTYTADGKLASRTWARGIVTTYSYDGAGQLTNINYSDNTPDVSFSFDRLGRQTTITDGQGTRAFTYNDTLQLAAETNAMGSITRNYDSLGRPAGFSLGDPTYSVRYGYDPMGRFSSVTSTNNLICSYSYLSGSDILSGWEITCGGTTSVSSARTYEPNRNLITQVLYTAGTNRISQFDYVNDAIGRRTQRIDLSAMVDSSSLTNDFGYNARSELIEALMGTNSHSYRYDPIGNRQTATNNAEAWSYAANALNQYSQITNNQSPITPTYDADGNMLTYNGWTFGWNGENRLITASNGATAVTFAYDFMGRRYQKVTGTTTNSFLYDGWNLISEVGAAVPSGSSFTNFFTWGLDLSGTVQGAGGIGGLLSATLSNPATSNSTTAFYAYDANGNVTDLVGASGESLAQYQFDPYGNTSSKTGQLADVNPFRFSTKYLDKETGLYYYGYRYYQPEVGRWVNRDPIAEKGHILSRDTLKKSLFDNVTTLGGVERKPCTGSCGKMAQPGSVRLSLPEKLLHQEPQIHYRLLVTRISRQVQLEQKALSLFDSNDPLTNYDPLGLLTAAQCVSFWEGCYDDCSTTYSGNPAQQAVCYAGCAAELAACMAAATAEYCVAHPWWCCAGLIIIIIPGPQPI